MTSRPIGWLPTLGVAGCSAVAVPGCNWSATAGPDPAVVPNDADRGPRRPPRTSLRGVEQGDSTVSSSAVHGLRFRVFGPLAVLRGGDELRLGGPKERAVLATLLAAGGEAVTVDGLVEALWHADPPRSAARTIHAYIARLRRTLGEDPAPVLTTEGRSYRLRPVDRSDAARFEEAARRGTAHAEHGDPGAAVADFDEALALWAGPPYEGFEDIERCAVAATVLEERRRAVVERRFAALLDLGQAPELIADLESAVAVDPLREHLWGQLMLALYRSGRQADALRAYQRARDTLVDELGIEPGRALRELEASILAQDDATLLAGPGSRAPVRSLPASLDAAGTAMVGRADDLARLTEMWKAATACRGGFVAIVGEEGAGKTRLAAALAAEAHRSGAVIAYARCDADHRSARTLLDQALRSANGSLVAAQAQGRPGEALGIGVGRHLATWSQRWPVLLVLDDLDRADAGVLEVVADLTAEVTSSATLVLGIFRSERGDGGRSTGAGAQIALGGLSSQEVAEVCALYGDAWTTDDLRRIGAASGGLPLAVHEMAAAAARQAMASEVRAATDQAQAAEHRLAAAQQSVADHVVGLQRVAEQRRQQLTSEPGSGTAGACPYRGLLPFDVEDAPWFFGRERLVAETIARLASRPVLAVVGASGSGKSSMVRAGVVPAIQGGVLPRSDAWRVEVTTPGAPRTSELWRLLNEADRRPGRPPLLIVVDQLEEVFTLGYTDADREALAQLLEEEVREGARLVAVVRGDQMAAVAEVPGLARLLGGRDVLVGPIREAELRDAIIRPAGLAGLRVEDGLVEEVVADARGATGVLPLVQTALLETWVHRLGRLLTVEGYRSSGGVRGAVARLAERAYDGLSPAEQDAARRILLRLADATADGRHDLRRRVPRSEMAPAGDTAAWSAFEHLVQHRLLAADDEAVEVSHEALLREWPRLRGWLEDDVTGRRLHQRLSEGARAWVDDGRDPASLLRGGRLGSTEDWAAGDPEALNDLEREYLDASRAEARRELDEAVMRAEREHRTSRRLRRLLAMAATLAAVAVLAGALAMVQRNRADRSAVEAEDAELLADASRLAALALVDQRIDRALLTAAAGTGLADTPETRAGLVQTVQRAPFALRISRLPNEARPQRVVLSPDEELVAVIDNGARIHVLDAETLEERAALQTRDANFDLAFLPEGDLAIGVAEEDGAAIHVVDPLEPEARVARIGTSDPSPPAVSSDASGRLLLGVAVDPTGVTTTFTVWDRSSGRPVFTGQRTGIFHQTRLAPDGRSILAVTDTDLVAIDTTTGNDRWRRAGYRTIAVSPDGELVAATVDRGPQAQDRRYTSVAVVDLTSGAPVRTVEATAAVTALTFGRDTLLIGTDDGTEIWEVDGERRIRLRGQANQAGAVAVSADGADAWSVSLDGTVVRWDATARSSVIRRLDTSPEISPGDGDLLTVAAAPDGEVYYVDGERLSVRDEATGAVDPARTIVTGQRFGVSALDWSPTEPTLAAGSGDGSVKLFDRSEGTELATWTSERLRSVTSVDFSADGETLAVSLFNDPIDGAEDGGPDVILLDARTLDPVARIDIEGMGASGVSSVVDQPGTDRLLLTHCCSWLAGNADAPTFISLYDRSDDGEVWRVEGREVRRAEFSGDGRRVLVSGDDGRIWILDAEDGSVLVDPVAAHDGWVGPLQESPDGELLLSAGSDAVVRLWRAHDLQPAGTFERGDGVAPGGRSARFVDGGRSVLMMDGVRVWHAPIGVDALSRHVCVVTGRDLTAEEWSILLPTRPRRAVCP